MTTTNLDLLPPEIIQQFGYTLDYESLVFPKILPDYWDIWLEKIDRIRPNRYNDLQDFSIARLKFIYMVVYI